MELPWLSLPPQVLEPEEELLTGSVCILGLHPNPGGLGGGDPLPSASLMSQPIDIYLNYGGPALTRQSRVQEEGDNN